MSDALRHVALEEVHRELGAMRDPLRRLRTSPGVPAELRGLEEQVLVVDLPAGDY